MPIVVENLNFIYNPNSPFEKHALKDVSITINDGDFLSIVGATGSGKSTFVQHLNGLIRVQSGAISIDGADITPLGKSKRKNRKKERINFAKLRGEVGMVFQYPEYQLFADTVYNDVAFGPKNLKLDKDEIDKRVKEALLLVGLDFDYVKDKSPFELSGGEKRRAAIAGVIAMRPKVLVLDEPTAGLDPKGKTEILQLVLGLKKICSPTVIMISHDMDAVAEYGSRVAVFDDGRIVYDLPPEQLFEKENELVEMGLELPKLAKLRFILKKHGVDIPKDCLSVEKMTEILKAVKSGGGSDV